MTEWKLVPVEPTLDMQHIAQNVAGFEGVNLYLDDARVIYRAMLEAAPPAPSVPECVVDLKHIAYNALTAAAMRSKWIPPEYLSNDWLEDCINFLENGHPVPADLVQDAERYRWLRKENAKLGSGYYVGNDTNTMPGDITWVGSDLDAAIDSAIAAEKGGAK